jgi:transcriptional regulator with XRE-family HTH domain
MNSENSKDFPSRVDIAVKKAGGPAALKKNTGISVKAIWTYTRGKSDPSTQNILAIAKAANVELEWLISGKGPMQRDCSENIRYEMAGEKRQRNMVSEDTAFYHSLIPIANLNPEEKSVILALTSIFGGPKTAEREAFARKVVTLFLKYLDSSLGSAAENLDKKKKAG